MATNNDFSKYQPQSLKDTFLNQEKAKEAYEKLKNELGWSAVTADDATKKKLDALKKEMDKAIKAHESEWNKYINNITKFMETINKDNVDINSIRPESLVSHLAGITNLTTVINTNIPKETKYALFQNENGETRLQPLNQDAIKAIRLTQANEYKNKINNLKTNSEFAKLGINLDSGLITHDLNGKEIDKNDYTARKTVLESIKNKLGDSFDSSNNPSFAKLEAVNNFVDKTDYNSPNAKGKYNYSFETEVNGVKFTMYDPNDSNFKHVLETNGATWQVLANAAKESNVSSMQINSIVRGSGSHSGGNGIDVGSITLSNGVTQVIKGFDASGNTSPLSLEVRNFLNTLRDDPSVQWAWDPDELLTRDANGGTTIQANLFQSLPPEIVNYGTNWDNLTVAQRNEIVQLIRIAANDSYFKEDYIKQMWDHRHHLHLQIF